MDYKIILRLIIYIFLQDVGVIYQFMYFVLFGVGQVVILGVIKGIEFDLWVKYIISKQVIMNVE